MIKHDGANWCDIKRYALTILNDLHQRLANDVSQCKLIEDIGIEAGQNGYTQIISKDPGKRMFLYLTWN